MIKSDSADTINVSHTIIISWYDDNNKIILEYDT